MSFIQLYALYKIRPTCFNFIFLLPKLVKYFLTCFNIIYFSKTLFVLRDWFRLKIENNFSDFLYSVPDSLPGNPLEFYNPLYLRPCLPSVCLGCRFCFVFNLTFMDVFICLVNTFIVKLCLYFPFYVYSCVCILLWPVCRSYIHLSVFFGCLKVVLFVILMSMLISIKSYFYMTFSLFL